MYGININLIYIFIIGPLLFGIGYKDPGKNMYLYQYLIGLLIILPFLLPIPKNISKSKEIKWRSIIYFFLVLPFLGYIAIRKDKSPEIMFNLLKIVGICIINSNIYLLVDKLIKKFKLI